LAGDAKPLAGEHTARGPHRVDRIALGALAAAVAAGSPRLCHPLALGHEEAAKARAVGAGPLDRPQAPARGEPDCLRKRLPVAGGVGGDRKRRLVAAGGGGDHRQPVTVAVGVDADDDVDVLCQHLRHLQVRLGERRRSGTRRNRAAGL
jgi:hypothetical protein